MRDVQYGSIRIVILCLLWYITSAGNGVIGKVKHVFHFIFISLLKFSFFYLALAAGISIPTDSHNGAITINHNLLNANVKIYIRTTKESIGQLELLFQIDNSVGFWKVLRIGFWSYQSMGCSSVICCYWYDDDCFYN